MTRFRVLLAGVFVAGALTALSGVVFAADQSKELSVEVKNKSEREICAEKDNVALELSSPDVKHMTVQAVHPSYIGMIVVDRYAPDFTSCDMNTDPVFATDAKRVTIFETPEMWMTGYAYPSFWRPGTVPVKVGNRVETGLHFVQFWIRHKERAEEVLVLYPPDGYWRVRPLPPAHLNWSAYGSSFLIGPVETQIRPIVDLKEISFDPDKKQFTLSFKRGGSATISIKIIDQDRFVLDVDYRDIPRNYPLAALRSMYVTQTNNDMAELAWRTKDGTQWKEAPIFSFSDASVTELWAGRLVPSRHNLSAPDMVFGNFR